jgi:hypothetical protein
MKILQISGDGINNLDDRDEQVKAIRKHIETLHMAMAKDGKSYVAVVEKKGGGIRLLHGAEVAKLEQYIDETKDDYKHWSIFEVDTIQ